MQENTQKKRDFGRLHQEFFHKLCEYIQSACPEELNDPMREKICEISGLLAQRYLSFKGDQSGESTRRRPECFAPEKIVR